MRFRYFTYCLAIAFLFSGCAEVARDNPLDPAISPFVLPLDQADFDLSQGIGYMSWRYIGPSAGRYRVIRHEIRSGEEVISDWFAPGTTSGGDAQPAQSYGDSDVRAGESYTYAVEIEDGLRSIGPVSLGQMVVPGARLDGVQLRFGRRAADIIWTVIGTSQIEEVKVIRRTVDRPEVVVAEVSGTAAGPYRDADLEYGRRYTYSVRTRFENGLDLESVGVDRGFYVGIGSQTLAPAVYSDFRLASHPVLLSAGSPQTGVFLRLVRSARLAGLLQVERQSQDGSIYGLPGFLSFPGSVQVDPLSLSIVVQEVGSAHLLLSSIVATTGQVRLDAFTVPDALQRVDAFGLPAVRRLDFDLEDWIVSSADRLTALALSSAARVYLAVGDRMRVVTAGLVEIGEVDLGLESPVAAIAVDEEHIWAATPETGQLLLSPPVLSGSSTLIPPRWLELEVPSGGRVVALSRVRGGGVVALDAGNKQVLAYDPEGLLLGTWGNLVGLAFGGGGSLNGGLTFVREKLYVWDTSGECLVFGTLDGEN